jgi:hypothetical protein
MQAKFFGLGQIFTVQAAARPETISTGFVTRAMYFAIASTAARFSACMS